MVVFSAGIVAILRLTFATGGPESRDTGENPILDGAAMESIVFVLFLLNRTANSTFHCVYRPARGAGQHKCRHLWLGGQRKRRATQPNHQTVSPHSQFKACKEISHVRISDGRQGW